MTGKIVSWAFLMLGASLGLLGGMGTAGAEPTVEAGWWTSSPVAVAPDVGEDDLLVQGGPSRDQPLAYAGISFSLDDGDRPELLTLAVAPDTATTPAAPLSLCALDAPASGASGEPAADGPTFDCATSVVAEPSDGGAGYEFDVTGFDADGSLDVAVVAARQGDRVVLEVPDATSLLLQDRAAPGGGTTVGGSAASPAPTSSGRGGSTAGGSVPTPTAQGPSVAPRAAPSVSMPPAPSPATGRDGDGAGDDSAPTGPEPPAPFAAVPAASQGAGGGSFPGALGFAVLAAAAAVLWTVAGNHHDDPAGDDATTA